MAKTSVAAARIAQIRKEAGDQRIVLESRPVRFLDQAKEALLDMGKEARTLVGKELMLVSFGEMPTDYKPMADIGPGTWEIRVQTADNWIRAFYVTTFRDAIWVLDVIEKKQNKTEKVDIDRARQRYKLAQGKSKEALAKTGTAKGKETRGR